MATESIAGVEWPDVAFAWERAEREHPEYLKIQGDRSFFIIADDLGHAARNRSTEHL
jgi:hypothetical protein